MSDVADMLGIGGQSRATSSSNAALLGSQSASATKQPKIKKPKGMSREVFGLIGPDSLVSAMQAPPPMTSAFQKKRVSALKGKWVWAPFSATNSHHSQPHLHAIEDSENAESNRAHAESQSQFLSHWVRAEVQYTEYPYAKFNIQLDRHTHSYTDEEYEALLQNPNWTRAETDFLMDCALKYDLRWPVISDRYNDQIHTHTAQSQSPTFNFSSNTSSSSTMNVIGGVSFTSQVHMRNTEDLQERYYSILSILKTFRSSSAANTLTTSSSTGAASIAATVAGSGVGAGGAVTPTPGTSNVGIGAYTKTGEPATIFNYEAEKMRRHQLDVQFRKTRDEEEEEIRLREELKQLDANIKKMKKATKQTQQANAAAAALASAAALAAQHVPPTSVGTVLFPTILANSASATASGGGVTPSAVFDPTTQLFAPRQGVPHLQSARLVGLSGGMVEQSTSGGPAGMIHPQAQTQLSKTLLRKMQCLLRELGLPETLMATRNVCDLYDQVRRDAIALLSLKSAISKKEKEIAALSTNATQELVLPNTTLLLSRLPPADMSSKQPIPGTTAQQVLEQVYRTTPTATPSATASSKTASSKSAAAAAASSGSGAAGTSTPLSEGAASVGSVPGGAGGMLIKTEPGLVSESAAAGSVASTPTKKKRKAPSKDKDNKEGASVLNPDGSVSFVTASPDTAAAAGAGASLSSLPMHPPIGVGAGALQASFGDGDNLLGGVVHVPAAAGAPPVAEKSVRKRAKKQAIA